MPTTVSTQVCVHQACISQATAATEAQSHLNAASSSVPSVAQLSADAVAPEEEAEDATENEAYQERLQRALAKYANVLERVEALESSSSQVCQHPSDVQGAFDTFASTIHITLVPRCFRMNTNVLDASTTNLSIVSAMCVTSATIWCRLFMSHSRMHDKYH